MEESSCKKYKRRYFRQCLARLGKCYKCGQAGHWVIDCLRDKNIGVQPFSYYVQEQLKRFVEGKRPSDHKF